MGQGGATSGKKFNMGSQIALLDIQSTPFGPLFEILKEKFGSSKFFAYYEPDLQKFSPTTNRADLSNSSSAKSRFQSIWRPKIFRPLQNRPKKIPPLRNTRQKKFFHSPLNFSQPNKKNLPPLPSGASKYFFSKKGRGVLESIPKHNSQHHMKPFLRILPPIP